jgi:D-alanyl-D-alanine carboxypeptidase/D-alanyl-D-alanine-endopeptidase (penicillin-binding protein 4)
LKRVKEPIVLTEPSALERYGSGWSWDDYNDGYVYERSWLPVYGNRLTIRRRSKQADLEVIPGLLSQAITLRVAEETTGSLTKLEGENRFFLAKRMLQTKREFKLQRPLSVSPELTARLLASGLGIDVSVSDRLPDSLQWTAHRIPRPDTLFKHMLLTSDNFLAEQLLLSAASAWNLNRHPDELRTYVRDSLLSELSISPRQWVDGSGLSRYNQLSPRQLTQLLRRIYLLVGPDKMKSHLPAGGVSGTLKKYFSNDKAPFTWAKTGSLRNVLALSGMIETSSGKRLLFSFLHNNFPGKSRAHYRAMEDVLTYIRDSY